MTRHKGQSQDAAFLKEHAHTARHGTRRKRRRHREAGNESPAKRPEARVGGDKEGTTGNFAREASVSWPGKVGSFCCSSCSVLLALFSWTTSSWCSSDGLELAASLSELQKVSIFSLEDCDQSDFLLTKTNQPGV